MADHEKPVKGEKENQKAAKEAPKQESKKQDFGPDFRYLVRIHNTDLDGKKPLTAALTYVPGVSHRMANVVAREAGIPATQRIGKLTDDQISAVTEAISALGEVVPAWMLNRRKDVETGEDGHLVGTEIQIMLREDLNRLKKIRSWRGHRHERKLPTRGQRTKANGRFGSAVGVQRKDAGQAAPDAAAAPAAAAGAKAAPKADAKPAAGAAKPAAAGAAKPAAAAAAKPAPGGKK
ncbi:MAG: 30S ribosomal protein S13 [Candidatus Thermoplasmatota archaeon]